MIASIRDLFGKRNDAAAHAPILKTLQLHPSLTTAPLPQVLNIETTDHCNLRCSHCGHSQFPEFAKGHASEALIEKLLPFVGKDRIPALGISGFGEPLLSPQWASLMARARSLPDVRISFTTNGLLLDRHFDALDHPRLDITISLDGATEKTYAHFRGAGHFDKVVKNLATLRDKEASGALTRSNRAFIVVLSRINVSEMAEIAELAARLGVATVVYTFQVFFDEMQFRSESLYFDRDAYDCALRIARARASDLGVTLIHPDSFDGKTKVPIPDWNRSWLWRDEKQRIRCGLSASNCYVTFHGQVEACCIPDRYIVGNLHEDDLLDVWYGQHCRRLRHSFLTARWTPPCHNCNLFQAVDVSRVQSHFLVPIRDDARLHSFPQPYRITELDAEYRAAVEGLLAGASPERALASLHRLLLRDPELFEVLNALAVAWLALRQRDKATAMLEAAARVAPDDPIVQQNLSRLASA